MARVDVDIDVRHNDDETAREVADAIANAVHEVINDEP